MSIPGEYLSSHDKQRLREVENLNQDAGNIFQEVDSIYKKIDNLKIEKDLTDESEQIKNLKNKTWQKEIKGFEIKSKANRLLHAIYERYIEKIEAEEYNKKDLNIIKALLIKEKASELFYKSSLLKDKANNQVKSFEGKIKTLENALNLEKLGFKKLKEAFELFYLTKIKSETGALKQHLEEKVAVNKSLLSSIYRILNSIDYEKKYFGDLWNLRINDTISLTSLQDIWKVYSNPDLEIRDGKIVKVIEEKIKQGELAERDSQKYEVEKTAEISDNAGETGEDTALVNLDNMVYWVQIAVSDKPLPLDTLKKRYDLKKEIFRTKEEGWYKYFMGNFTSYNDADEFRKELPGKNLFIIAQESGKQLSSLDFGEIEGKPVKIDEEEGKKEISESTLSKKMKERIVYRVQIAADRVTLKPSKLDSIYSGTKKVYFNKGDGWYRYSIGDCPTYYHARRLKEHTDVKGDWVVAYSKQKRLNAYNMKTTPGVCPPLEIKRNVAIRDDGVVFSLQIAASDTKLTEKELRYIYWGDMEVLEIKQGKYYRYSIGNFRNYSEAAALKKTVCVPGANVLTFIDGQLLDEFTVSKRMKEGIVYRVQIAADRVRLKPSKLDSIYSGIKKVYFNKGDGWYRYSIGDCPTYYHARRLKEHTDVKGDWVVAYSKQKRLNAYNMKTTPGVCPPLEIKRNVAIRDDGVVFSLQIAASDTKLTEKELRYIYCGDMQVLEIKQGKSYRYSIGNFRNYRDALALKKKVCVPGAIVMAFENGQPIDVLSAIKQKK